MTLLNHLARPFIIDAHQDVAWNWFDLGRDPAESAVATRPRELGNATPTQLAMGTRTCGLPEWLAGRVGVIFASLFVMPARSLDSSRFRQVYADPETAHLLAWKQLESYRRLADREPQIALVETAADLEPVIASWSSQGAEPVVGLVALMEGADAIREPAELHDWYAAGLRIVGPAWAGTRYAGGTGEPGPLTALGLQLLSEMARLNMILDLSHLAERAFLEATDAYAGALIASHSNPGRFSPGDRGLSDEMIRQLAARQGVVGIAPFNAFLRPGWRIGDQKELVTVRVVAEAIDYVTQLTGSCEHVGLGTDMDGAFGAESIPAEMDSIADLYLVADALNDLNYSTADVELILNGNWLRILKRCLP